ncbi:hypothetical protein C8R44DRAFT_886492 [Mycena epipterygia]|nr:hypothetical protein C8R44DRAFT_886492 [Mycena epipterygia]
MADPPELEPVDPTLCIDVDAPGESCGGLFEHKNSSGLCAMCYMTKNNAPRAEEMKTWPQCDGCSAQFKLLKGPRYGICLKKDQLASAPVEPRLPLAVQDLNFPPAADPTTKTLQDLQTQARRDAMAARTLHKSGSKALTGSGSLQAAVAKGTARQITLYLVPMTSSGSRTDATRILANATRSFPEDMTRTDALTHLLRHWNLDWEKYCSQSLAPEHVSLRLLGNVGIEPHSTHGTLGHFLDTHERVHGNHPKKIIQGPTTLRLPAPAIYLEGFISVTDFETSTGTQAPYFVHTEKENRKRKTSQTNTQELASSKRSRTFCAGSFALRVFRCPWFLKGRLFICEVSILNDGAVNIEFPDLNDLEKLTTLTCLLQDAPFDQGKTKKVHKVILDGLPWVTKRFFNIGAGEGVVEIQENYHQVVKEVTHLSKAGYFLKRFIMEANKQAVDITQGIEVTEFKLGIEVVQDTCGPSKASGFSLDQYQLASSAQIESKSNHGIIVWLFEPRCSSTVSHWSGTNDLESTVLADLQTATTIDEDGNGIQVLFDVMFHTLDASSGVGNHGMTGIDTFLEQHECVDRCKQLHLQRGGFSTESAVEDSDEDDG